MQATFFKRYFYVSFDIFISTSRTTLISLPTHSLIFGECLRYFQSVLKMIFTILEAPRSEFFPLFEEIFISNDSRIVKNHFQHTLKVPKTLSKQQGMRR